MDDLTSEILVKADGPDGGGSSILDIDDREDEQSEAGDGPGSKKRRGLRSLLKGGATMQDKFLERLIQQVFPADLDGVVDVSGGGGGGKTVGMEFVAEDSFAGGLSTSPTSQRPNFNISTMSYNFRRFNARIGVMFKFQARVVRLLSWRRPTQTLSFLAVYTLVCLDPHLITVLPPVLLLAGVLIPSFLDRHPEPPPVGAAPGTVAAAGTGSNISSNSNGSGSSGNRDSARYPTYTGTSNPDELAHNRSYYAQQHPAQAYSARGPPVAPARTVKPVKELSRDFFRNMRELQNSMADFVVAHDAVVENLLPVTNFSDEARSSALFVALLAASAAMSIAAHLLPWRTVLLASGWATVCSGHPTLARRRAAAAAAAAASVSSFSASSSSSFFNPSPAAADDGASSSSSSSSSSSPLRTIGSLLDAWASADIILDTAPQAREVEIFELQRRSSPEAGEWEPWTFSPSPYDPLSPARLAGDLPPGGTRFFEDVLAPEGWEWSEKKWALDLWSREWVEERIITGVEVETEGERWVYDIYNEHEGDTGVVENPTGSIGRSSKGTSIGSSGSGSMKTAAGRPPKVTWEETYEGVGRRGQWRRRRWVRLVKRKKVVSTGG